MLGDATDGWCSVSVAAGLWGLSRARPWPAPWTSAATYCGQPRSNCSDPSPGSGPGARVLPLPAPVSSNLGTRRGGRRRPRRHPTGRVGPLRLARCGRGSRGVPFAPAGVHLSSRWSRSAGRCPRKPRSSSRRQRSSEPSRRTRRSTDSTETEQFSPARRGRSRISASTKPRQVRAFDPCLARLLHSAGRSDRRKVFGLGSPAVSLAPVVAHARSRPRTVLDI